MTEGTIFKRLELGGWRQFAKVDVEFHDRLTVLTGANGAGKSTLLNILSRHAGWERPYLSVPRRSKDGQISYFSGRLTWDFIWESFLGAWKWKPENQVGEIRYSNDQSSGLSLPVNVGTEYGLEIPHQQAVHAISISSHALMPRYQQVPNLPFNGIPPDNVFGQFASEAQNRYMGQSTGQSLMFQIKQAIAAWAVFGEGNSVLQANLAQQQAYDGFVEILRKVLPPSLGFLDLAVRPPDVLLVTRSGEFLIDAASGGVTTLVEVAALIYGCSIRANVKGKRFAVIYDEPENHLHPQLQRSLFQSLTTAFPTAQFIVATHSPFIVSSLKNSNVYVLRYQDVHADQATDRSRVVSERLDYTNRAGTASEILREVLGLPSTLPEWVENDLKSIVTKYQTSTLDEGRLKELKADLRAAGLSELFPEALSGLARDR
jgi:energy-coupling factor transporter ATP-binding protein EcfA2